LVAEILLGFVLTAIERVKVLRCRQLFPAAFSLAILVVFASITPLWSFTPEDDLTAKSALLMDAATGRILFQKEPDLRLPPASTTKVMTAILALESGRNLSESLTVSKDATRVPPSKLYLRPGQTMPIEELLYAIMLASANDASVVLAEGIGGSVERYTDLMTKKAHSLGAINSHFTNPHGLTAPDHYSTTRDLATIFRYAMKIPLFREIVQTKFSSVSSLAVVKKKVVPRRISVRNHNRLLWDFEGALGGKTGYTHAAQRCYVGAVQRDGVTLIVAILGATNMWSDAKHLLAYGFDNYDILKPASQTTQKPIFSEGSSRQRTSMVILPGNNERPKSVEGFVLQVGSFRERERAELLSRQINDLGFDAFIEVAAAGRNDAAYRVQVGPYAELVAAQEVAQVLLAKNGQRSLIRQFPAAREAG
jgi:D-alanyl-D-alanine carboxypeptidase (penicillin-binding protein 5/6)